MNVLVIGGGSIGRRRIRILAGMGHRIRCEDVDGERADRIMADHPSYAADISPDAILICTPPTDERVEQIQSAIARAPGVFIEKPLATSRAACTAIANIETGKCITMGACNLRFINGVAELQTIPRPWYGELKLVMRQGAQHWSPSHQPISMILDSIHELDLAIHLQGPAVSIRGQSDLREANVSVHHADGGWSRITLDRYTSPPRRYAKLDEHTIALETYDGMYEREMAYFLRHVAERLPTFNDLQSAATTCSLALEVA